ncbi:Protein of unknown function [Quadrisphaera granulorum]|uniref:Uncharacterized protein DUF559 n=1 Tax=Quadrisphaera granulorum TaxID=317664 RepID=A0A315ZUK8_9ACTN|nr:DUF559 domain-containing protein [Quadrisphaera granulorum]PWJ48630.1 uncharacterized protein DUF559 [Quadrisphaera granulorum]SZE98352.1 Protein of unknown function [Quadrisphaera granulorum]
MPHVRTPLPAQLRYRPFTVAEARKLGVSDKRMRSSDLRAPFRGVRVSTGLRWTLLLRAQCALLAAPPGSVVTGANAVEILGLPTPFGARPAMDGDVTIAVPAGTRGPERHGIVVRHHPIHPACGRWVIGDVGLPALEDLWADRCADLDEESAIALGDAVLRRLKNHRQAMSAAVDRLPMEQQAAARKVLDQVRYEVCSPVETRLRLLLQRAGLPEASHYAAPIPRTGRAQIWPDLQWESVRVAVEIDGPHHAAELQHESDIRRNRRTSEHGWTQVVVSSREVMAQPRDVVRWISDELRKAGLRW